MPHVEGKYNVSFSGLKTAVLNEVNQAQMKGTDINVPDLAASFQERIAGILAEKLLLAAADFIDLINSGFFGCNQSGRIYMMRWRPLS